MTRLFRTVAFAAALTPGLALAADKAPAAKPAAPAAATDKAATGGDMKAQAEVVDLTCYVAGEKKGDKHASCAAKCIGAGMPAGLLINGKLYTAVMRDHSAPSAKLAAWGGKSVTVTGKAIEREGAQLFEIDSVDAPAPAAKK